MKTNGKKLRASLLAGALAVALVLTGTFAWRSMSQRTVNKIMDSHNPGGRVHDDFSYNEIAKNKDVYAENFTDEIDGAPVFARIKLLEYMETGEDAGINLNVKDRKAKPVLWGDRTYVSVNDTSTWKVFDPNDPDDPFRKYWDLTFGGSTNYLPTFNKNKDSLSVDVNGTYEGNNKLFDDTDPYSDYVIYSLGQEVTLDAYYDADPNDDDEYTAGGSIAPGAGGTEGVNYTKKSEKHTVQPTLNSLGIMTMSQWVEAGCPVCNRWIYDDSENGGGWFYWPKPIMPQSATGLLLDKVDQRMTAGEKSYYAIEVVGEFATAGQWGIQDADEDADKGFYLNGFSDDAKALLDQATLVKTGKDKKWYLNKGNGVYQQILNETGTLGGLVCAGKDELIGTTDDRKSGVVYVEGGLTTADGVSCGAYFLEPTATENYYRGTTPTGSLGTDEDLRIWVVNGSFPDGTLTTRPVTAVVVKSENNASQVKLDTTTPATLQLTPAVTLADGVTDDSVAWSLTGNTDAGTTISETGLLTVSTGETADTELTVTATSKLDGRVSGSVTITVVNDITTTLDGIEYYVLKTDLENNRALVLSKDIPVRRRVDPVNTTPWWNSELCSWLNDTGSEGWLGKNPDLNGCTIETPILTRVWNTKDQWNERNCKVFLLSEADIWGEQRARYGEDTTIVYHDAYPNDYTAGGKLDAPSCGWSTFEVTGWPDAPEGERWFWTRSPGASLKGDTQVDCGATGSWTIDRKNTGGVRPAAWVMINGVNVEAANSATGVAVDGTLQFSATVVENMRPTADQTVTWKVTGGAGKATIDETGLLNAAGEALGATLKVTATSAEGMESAAYTVTVRDGVDVYGKDVVTLDTIDFYVLKREDGKALVLSVNLLDKRQMHASNAIAWKNSDLCTYLNGEWLNGKTQIQDFAIQTTIQTRAGYNATTFDSNACKVFLLTAADVSGRWNLNAAQAEDYTAGSILRIPGGSWTATWEGRAIEWWLRSPTYDTGSANHVDYNGGVNGGPRTYEYGVRPAMWIKTL